MLLTAGYQRRDIFELLLCLSLDSSCLFPTQPKLLMNNTTGRSTNTQIWLYLHNGAICTTNHKQGYTTYLKSFKQVKHGVSSRVLRLSWRRKNKKKTSQDRKRLPRVHLLHCRGDNCSNQKTFCQKMIFFQDLSIFSFVSILVFSFIKT